MQPTADYKTAMAAGRDAGNRSARAAGRSEWNEADYATACNATERLLGPTPTSATSAPLLDGLDVSRAKDRKVIANAILALRSPQWSVEVNPDMSDSRRIWLVLKGPCGLNLILDLDGDNSQQRDGVFVLSWFVRHSTDESVNLNPGVWQDVNPYHYRKATDIAYGVAVLLGILEQRMSQAVTGEAFQKV